MTLTLHWFSEYDDSWISDESEIDMSVADVYQDGSVDDIDASTILRALVNGLSMRPDLPIIP